MFQSENPPQDTPPGTAWEPRYRPAPRALRRVPIAAGDDARRPEGDFTGLKASSRKPQSGFSLVELLVVLVILGLLVGLVAPNFWRQAEQSHAKIANVQIENLHVALQTYRLDVGRYPSTEQGLAALMKAPAEVAEYWNGPYLGKEIPLDPWKTPYQYRYPVENLQGIALYSFGADGAQGGEGDNADIGFLPVDAD